MQIVMLKDDLDEMVGTVPINKPFIENIGNHFLKNYHKECKLSKKYEFFKN